MKEARNDKIIWLSLKRLLHNQNPITSWEFNETSTKETIRNNQAYTFQKYRDNNQKIYKQWRIKHNKM